MTSQTSSSRSSKDAISQELNQIYSNPQDAGSYGGQERLYQSARSRGLKVNRQQVAEFLKGKDAYTLHKPARKHYSRNPTIVATIDQQWQADLADVSSLGTDNDEIRYLLTVVDCFSKFAWVVPLKRKDSQTLEEAFATLLRKSAPRKPQRLQTDKGKEFLNAPVQQLFRKNGIKHFTTENETKAAMVERFNRTLKTRLWTYMTANNTDRYIDVLDKVVHSYNHSVHRSIGMRPADVKPVHVSKIFHRLYGRYFATSSAQPKVPIGQTVRVSSQKTAFDKGYRPNWTRELFQVVQSHPSTRKPVYKLEDWEGADIEGKFYPDEIQSVKEPDENTEYLIERTIKKRKAADVSGYEYLVKWQGWPEKFNSWIPEAEYAKSK